MTWGWFMIGFTISFEIPMRWPTSQVKSLEAALRGAWVGWPQKSGWIREVDEAL